MGRRAANAVPEQAVEHTLESEMAAEENLSNAADVAPYVLSDLSEVPSTLLLTVRVTAECGLNLRSGPGMQYPIVAVLPQDTLLCAFFAGPDVEGWQTVTTDDHCIGWVDRRYIEPADPEEE